MSSVAVAAPAAPSVNIAPEPYSHTTGQSIEKLAAGLYDIAVTKPVATSAPVQAVKTASAPLATNVLDTFGAGTIVHAVV